MGVALALAMLSPLCFGIALVSGRIGLRTLDARSGAAISIPTATVLFLLAAPFAFDSSGFTVPAALLFAVTGLLNGGAVILMYGALSIAPVSFVAPIVATYPLITAIVSAVVLREEPLTPRMVAGATITVLAIVYLVASNAGA